MLTFTIIKSNRQLLTYQIYKKQEFQSYFEFSILMRLNQFILVVVLFNRHDNTIFVCVCVSVQHTHMIVIVNIKKNKCKFNLICAHVCGHAHVKYQKMLKHFPILKLDLKQVII